MPRPANSFSPGTFNLRRRNPVAIMMVIDGNSSPLLRTTRLVFRSTLSISTFVQRSNAQALAIVSMKAKVVIDWIVYPRELAAHRFVLLEHQRVEPQLVTPTRRRKTGRASAND